MQFIRKNIIVITGLIVVVLLLLSFAWYPYQRSNAEDYLSAANTCSGSVLDSLSTSARKLSCTQGSVVTIHRFLLGIGASYSYTTRAECASGDDRYTGNIITIFGKRFDVLAQAKPTGSQLNSDLMAC